MKVCPVQKFGLEPVLEEFESTGRILGKGTDELEGYDWPIDGQHYGPDETPRVSIELMNPPGFVYDPERTEVPESSAPEYVNISARDAGMH